MADVSEADSSLAESFKKWSKGFKEDFFKKEYAPLKLLFFLIYGANFCLLPFLTLQARSLGITEEEVGIIYSFMPIAALLAPPITGMIADCIGNFKLYVSAMTAAAGLVPLLLLLVPVGRIIHHLPEDLHMDVVCSSKGGYLALQDAAYCEHAAVQNIQINLNNCSVTCSEWHSNFTSNPYNLECSDATKCLADLPDSNSTLTYSLGIQDEDHLVYQWPQTLTLHSQLMQNGSVSYATEHLCPQPIEGSASADHSSILEGCTLVCEATGKRSDFCSKEKFLEDVNPEVAFYGHLAARLCMEFSLAFSMPLLEGAAASVLKQLGGDFGFQRLYANLGMVCITPISGVLIDYFSKVRGFEDFSPSIYLYCGLKLLSALIMLFLNLEFKQSSNRLLKEFWSLLSKVQVIAFLVSALIAGICFGFLENFLFWLLQDLGADKKLMGITVMIGSFFGVPVLMASGYIIKKLGHINTLVMGFLLYIVRFFGYTIIPNPWLAMPFEALECITTSLMLVAFVSYAAIVATPGTVVTLQGVFGGLHFGVGRAFGSLLGGFLIEEAGLFETFRIMGGIGGVTGIVYGLINFFFFRKNDLVKSRKAADAIATETTSITQKKPKPTEGESYNGAPQRYNGSNGLDVSKTSTNGHVNTAFDEN